MPYPMSHRTATTRHQPPLDAHESDALLLDDEDDEVLDRHLAAIRESLADFRNV
jgi:hypothetical protein